MQRLEVSGAIRPIYGSLAVKRLSHHQAVYGNSKEQFTTVILNIKCEISAYTSTSLTLNEYSYFLYSACCGLAISLRRRCFSSFKYVVVFDGRIQVLYCYCATTGCQMAWGY